MRKRKCAQCLDSTTNYIIIDDEELYVCENGHLLNNANYVNAVKVDENGVPIKKVRIAHCPHCGTELRPKDFIMNTWVRLGFSKKPICLGCYFK